MILKLIKSFCFFLPLFLLAAERPFVIVVPSFNNKVWCENNLNSIFNQKYQNYRVIYIADAPTDGTVDAVQTIVKKRGQEHRFTLLQNKEYSGPLACMAQAIYLCDKNEIVVDLDGTDWLAHADVLSYLNQVYADPEVWMTYGQFTYYPDFSPGFAKEIPAETIDNNAFRTLRAVVTHLRTFYAGLFHKIEKEDFFWVGNFIPKAGDLAYSIPMLEMSGKHTKLITELLYIYNRTSPVNEHKASSKLETNLDQFIRNKKKYSPLMELPLNYDTPMVYNSISDLMHPTAEDYRLIQDFLSQGTHDRFSRLRDLESTVRDFKLTGDETPQAGTIAINCDSTTKENCILLYAPFNNDNPKRLKELILAIAQSGYKGHILYWCGGWPYTANGGLKLAHVPLAHRVCAFKEAQSLGYQRALWLDVSQAALMNLNGIFDQMQMKGHVIRSSSEKMGRTMNTQAAAFFGLSPRQTSSAPVCSGDLLGLDFTHESSRLILDWWWKAAHDQDAFFTPRADLGVLSLILYKLNITME